MGLASNIQEKTGHAFPLLSMFPWFQARLAPAAAPSVTVADVEAAAAASHAEMTAEELEQLDEMERVHKEDIHAHNLKTPQQVGAHTSWDGKKSLVWYYPTQDLYGVEVTFNQSLSTGPRYATLSEAQSYARESTRT